MNKPLRIIAAILTLSALAVFALVGCAGGQKAGSSSSGTIEVLDAEGVVSVPLDYSAGTGFTWQCSLPEGDKVLYIASENDEDLAKDERLDGGPLRHWVTLRAANPGTTTLTCELVRPWEGGEHGETQIYRFTVDNDLQISFNADESTYTLEPEWGSNS